MNFSDDERSWIPAGAGLGVAAAERTVAQCRDRLCRASAAGGRNSPQTGITNKVCTASGARQSALGADTIVVVGREILGKPRDRADAARMLRRLSGRPHKVVTAVALIGSNQNKFEDVRAESTKVVFNRLSAADIRDYVASGEPMDKAGAYAIQGRASRWIPKIVGDYCNVVGLPVTLVVQMMKKRGLI